jgi:hypothetical protein
MPVRNNPLGSVVCPMKRTKCIHKKVNGKCKKREIKYELIHKSHPFVDGPRTFCMDVKRPMKVGNGK